MPVAKPAPAQEDTLGARQAWTEELTIHRARVAAQDPAGIDPYAPSGRKT